MERIQHHLTASEWADFQALADRLGLTVEQALSQIHLDLPETDCAGFICRRIECPEHPGLPFAGGF